MGMLEKAGTTRRICPVFFLLDASGSMSGAPLGAVNQAMKTIIPELLSMNETNPDVEIKIAVLVFEDEDETRWITGSSMADIEGFVWNDLVSG